MLFIIKVIARLALGFMIFGTLSYLISMIP